MEQFELDGIRDFANAAPYETLREIFFKQLTTYLNKKIDATNYSTEQPLDELLKQFDMTTLFLYIWKDAYLRAYVFDKEDQRRELRATAVKAASIVCDEKLRNDYINNHDEFVKHEDAKLGNSVETVLQNVK